MSSNQLCRYGIFAVTRGDDLFVKTLVSPCKWVTLGVVCPSIAVKDAREIHVLESMLLGRGR